MNNMNIKTIAKIVALAIILLSKTLGRLLHLSAAAVACVGFAIFFGILLQTLIQILRIGIATGVWHKGMLAYYAVITLIFAFLTVMLAMRAMIDGVIA
ncbi:hypothetical protein CIK92_12080 [Prevotella sp. P4-67]|uniref:hypothetical protein n=1 Tax=Prevotella sp. P4-67 TaxID=2024227 RepID=UPI000B97C9E6|nr:hypothetical protein [Prevotella sp. P4-67]OYP69644.1 hypothetical protein CIK92_12080 [Prevotella sp. P4-67]